MPTDLEEKLFSHKCTIYYDQSYHNLANLISYARTQNEADNLHFVVGNMLRDEIILHPHNNLDFELEAKLINGSDDLDMDEPEDASYEIEIRPVKGFIRKVSFHNRELEIPQATPESVRFFWRGLPHYFRGIHTVNIFYNPKELELTPYKSV